MLHTFMTLCLHKLVLSVCLAVIALIAFSHRILKQNNCDVKYFRENIRQYFIFSIAVLICSHSSYLLSFFDTFA